MNFFSNQPLKGMNDELPEDLYEYKYIREKIEIISSLFNYQEYDAPVLEPLSLYAAKSSEELVKEQSYCFIDRGKREVVLRPEMTPSLARIISRVVKEKSRPFRWYSIPKCYRYERPQKGRLREFRQVNFDLLGYDGVYGDLEIIQMVVKLMEIFSVPTSKYIIYYNNRKMISEFLSSQGFAAEKQRLLFRLIDKKNKLNSQEWEREISIFSAREKKVIEEYCSTNSPISLLRKYQLQNLEIYREMELIQNLAQQMGLESYFQFNPLIVRGLDYYTGMVFEVYSQSTGISRALFGGGRYDHLLELFSKEKLSGIGFGMGVYIFSLFLKENKLLTLADKNKTIYQIAFMGDENYSPALKLANQIRDSGKTCELVPIKGSVKKIFQKAETRKLDYIAIVGDNEVEQGWASLHQLNKNDDKRSNDKKARLTWS